jgi:exonuclease SbcD
VASIEPFRFLHTGDLHLDSPFRGVTAAAPPAVAAVLRESSTTAWRRVVGTAIEERVDFVVVAGDVFEHANRTLLGQTRFRDGLAELAAAGITSFVVHGNHDPLDGRSWAPSLEFPDEAHRFGTRPGSAPVFRDGREIARVYGVSYDRAAVTRNLARELRREPGVPYAVGLLHTNVGDRPGHANYAPCSLDDLRAAGMDYWALGHIHRPGIVSERDPVAVYCGIPQGRDPGELEARGAWLVEVDAAGRTTPSFVACDVVRWEPVEVGIERITDDEEMRRAILARLGDASDAAGGRSLVIRLRLTGRGPMHASLVRPGYAADLRTILNEQLPIEPPFGWVESIRDETRPEVDLAARRGVPDFVGDFLRTADTARRAGRTTDPEEHESWRDLLRSSVAPLFDAPRARRFLAEARPDDAALFGELLDEAEALGFDGLLTAEEGR